MQIPLYSIFGDNYILQLATEAENSKITPNYVEIEDKELKELLRMAAEIAEYRERHKMTLPLSENDSKLWFSALSCYNFPKTSSLSQVFRGFSKVKECDEVTAPSFIKPEFYEYGRFPGRVDKEKIRVEPHYIILAAAGWVLTRIGRANVGNAYVGVNVFSPQGGILYSLNKRLSSLLPGVKPETAFSLWISKKVSELAVNTLATSFLRVYIITDATRYKPTVINGGFTVEVGKILEKKSLLTDKLEKIAERALKVDNDMRDYYIKLVNYIYEYINGSKRIEDLIYFANRDLIMSLESKGEKIEDLKLISSYVNGELLKKEVI